MGFLFVDYFVSPFVVFSFYLILFFIIRVNVILIIACITITHCLQWRTVRRVPFVSAEIIFSKRTSVTRQPQAIEAMRSYSQYFFVCILFYFPPRFCLILISPRTLVPKPRASVYCCLFIFCP